MTSTGLERFEQCTHHPVSIFRGCTRGTKFPQTPKIPSSGASGDTFNDQERFKTIPLLLLAWHCTLSCQEQPAPSRNPNNPNFIPAGATPQLPPHPCSEQRLFPSPCVGEDMWKQFFHGSVQIPKKSKYLQPFPGLLWGLSREGKELSW